MEGLKAAFETTKQFITLATGILALTVTFADKFNLADTKLAVPGALKFAWIIYCGVILFGVVTLMALTGSMDKKANNPSAKVTVNDSNIKVPALLMIGLFLVAIGLTVAAGFGVVR